ncbi:MAG: four-carbon acid sugar kinase family protein, partial [Burkholderiaceae bacterium]|nr:four-carbon acid sugar kinase family protein [Burkholderiaceae bacterium]
MRLGCIADDFTGAADIANTLTRGGLRTVLAIGVPAQPPPAADAVVVALKTRSIDPEQAVAQSLAACDWLAAHGCGQFVFKICSTFDSTPRGNIGPVAEALRERLAAGCVAVCPAFPANGRTVYRGHLFVGDALLNESGMEKHPLNPMTDANLVRVLQAQSRSRVALIGHEVVRAGPAAIAQRLKALDAAGFGFAIVDAVCDADLLALGAALADARLAVGGSGIALGLPQNFRARGEPAASEAKRPPLDGNAVLLAGSCSNATRAQVAAYDGPRLQIDPARVVGDATYLEEVRTWCLQQRRPPLVASSAAAAEVAALQAVHGAHLAQQIERFFGDLAAALLAAGVRRFIVAGGETSGAVVAALGVRLLEVGAEIDPGVPVLWAREPAPLALALKS